MIDLAKLAEVANRPGATARVGRGFLRQVLEELTEARAASARPVCFGERKAAQ